MGVGPCGGPPCVLYLASCFFKQKTAYEIRPRDLSSDVCSSDLTPSTSSPSRIGKPKPARNPELSASGARGKLKSFFKFEIHTGWPVCQMRPGSPTFFGNNSPRHANSKSSASTIGPCHTRSEEHTSEPQ